MTVAAERIMAELTKLSDTERGELAHFLIHSLDHEMDADVESAWDIELGRRADEIKSGHAAGEPADKVFSELRAKYL